MLLSLWFCFYIIVGFLIFRAILLESLTKSPNDSMVKVAAGLILVLVWPAPVLWATWNTLKYMLTRKKGSASLREISHYEISHYETPADAIKYQEVELSSCEYGCKIYEHVETGDRVLAHNSAYGCKK